jgi:hypothetical protein
VTLRGPVGRTYYHVSYREYAAGSVVEPFGERSVQASACIRELVATRLSELRPNSDAIEGGTSRSFELSSADPDSAAVLEADAGGSAIWQLRLWPRDATAAALRSTVLSIAFDDSETVRVPLGDFFGAGTFPHAINALAVGVQTEGPLTSRWPMPFQERARIALESAAPESQSAMLEVTSSAEPWTQASLHFHASWRAPETFASKPSHDWNLATIEGQGVYVGNVLNLINRNDAWWGEGDEKIYVDAEAFPSHFGTGTEDYYGYAWCSNETFSTPYIGQPQSTEQRSFGRTSLYRFHISDPLPFQSSLRFELEVRHWGDPVDVTYDAASFWYARPGSRMTNATTDPALFQIPALDASPPPDVPQGRYTCGP